MKRNCRFTRRFRAEDLGVLERYYVDLGEREVGALADNRALFGKRRYIDGELKQIDIDM